VRVSGWFSIPNNRTGSGYGIRISRKDRDRFFRSSWESVTLELDSGEIFVVKITDSFWRKCTELRSSKIGKWFLEKGLAPWPKGKPPRFTLKPVKDQYFRLSHP
jgi:hypothetical protein